MNPVMYSMQLVPYRAFIDTVHGLLVCMYFSMLEYATFLSLKLEVENMVKSMLNSNPGRKSHHKIIIFGTSRISSSYLGHLS